MSKIVKDNLKNVPGIYFNRLPSVYSFVDILNKFLKKNSYVSLTNIHNRNGRIIKRT